MFSEIRLLAVCKWRHQKHEYANDDQFAPNFDMDCKTAEVMQINEDRFMGQRSWGSFYYVIWENGLVGILLLTNMAAAIMYRDFLNFEQL